MVSRMKTFVHLHCFDLRLHDSLSLHVSHSSQSPLATSITHFLPVYIFDERQLDLSQLPDARPAGKPAGDQAGTHQEARPGYHPQHTRSAPLSRVGKFHRTSPHRLAFLLQSVFELREGYRRSGGDLLIGYGRPEVLIPSLVKKLQEDGEVAGVWAQKEYTLEETRTLDKIADGLPQGVDLHFNDTKTLLPPKHLPFNPAKNTPDVYTAFRKKVEGMGLNLGEGMLVEPVKTAKWSNKGNGVENVVVSVGQEGKKLKPYPELGKLGGERGSSWIEKGSDIDSPEGLYAKLSKPLFDNPPLGGWSSSVKEGQLPQPHPNSAIPFDGGEVAALSRLEDYVGHAKGDSWEGGAKAKTYKNTRNGLIGEHFSTKFAAFLSLGTLSPKEAGWRVGELLELVNRDKDTRGNVYCKSRVASTADNRDHLRTALARLLPVCRPSILRVESIMSLRPAGFLFPDIILS